MVAVWKSTKSNFKKSSLSCKTRYQPGLEYTKFILVCLAVVDKSRGHIDKLQSKIKTFKHKSVIIFKKNLQNNSVRV